jgi:hypothetical protein
MALTNKQKAISAINREGSFNTGEKRSLRNALDYTFDEISSGGGFDPNLLSIVVTPGDNGPMTIRIVYDGGDTPAVFSVSDLLSANVDNELIADPADGGLFYENPA